MDAILIIALASFATAALTLYSGFGLGTLLMPVMALFFPVETAVAATAVVHAANSIFKMAAVGRHADRALVIRFGVPAIFAAFVGAAALGYVSHIPDITRYTIGSIEAVITPVKLVMGLLMLLFAIFELSSRMQDLRFKDEHLVIGGILSGFFGGFSGHQGALRSAFLVKVGASTETFVGTSAVIGFLVDMARIVVYGVVFFIVGSGHPVTGNQVPLILVAVFGAFIGVVFGKRFLHKITMRTVQTLTGILLLLIALALGAGII